MGNSAPVREYAFVIPGKETNHQCLGVSGSNFLCAVAMAGLTRLPGLGKEYMVIDRIQHPFELEGKWLGHVHLCLAGQGLDLFLKLRVGF